MQVNFSVARGLLPGGCFQGLPDSGGGPSGCCTKGGRPGRDAARGGVEFLTSCPRSLKGRGGGWGGKSGLSLLPLARGLLLLLVLLLVLLLLLLLVLLLLIVLLLS